MDNFDYVTKELGNDKIAEIYSLLGPLDYSQYTEPKEDDSPRYDARAGGSDDSFEEKRVPVTDFEKRRSGAIYRGNVLTTNNRPDGPGIKIFNGNSLFEGFFSDGRTHGYGRAITSKGEVYQGGFHEDHMDGYGFYVWPDGRIYEGEWQLGKKSGNGKYFWPNG